MRTRRRFGVAVLAVAALGLLLGGAGRADAAPITLFNTGVNGAGTPLSEGTVGDPHYTLVSVPSGSSAILVRTSAGGFPIPPWLGDDAVSAWIKPDNPTGSSSSDPLGQYDYRTTFTLSSPSLVNITGQWSSDNDAVDILLNGIPTGNSNLNPTAFQAFTPFSISGLGVAGTNTLDFLVVNEPNINGPNPTGLRVEFTSATATVPEPSTLALLSLGGIALAGWRRWKRKRLQNTPTA